MNTNLFMEIMGGTVHAIESVQAQPCSLMTQWRLFQVQVKGRRSRHLVGRADGEGRVCSPIVVMDLAALRVTTQSTRLYQLQGPPGRDGDADWVFDCWCSGVGATQCKDMTRALMRLRHRRGLWRKA